MARHGGISYVGGCSVCGKKKKKSVSTTIIAVLMQTCDPLEHPSAGVRRSNIVRIARLGGARAVSCWADAICEGSRVVSGHCFVRLSCAGGDAELQKLARVARHDTDASCRATAIAAMVAIRLHFCLCVHGEMSFAKM